MYTSSLVGSKCSLFVPVVFSKINLIRIEFNGSYQHFVEKWHSTHSSTPASPSTGSFANLPMGRHLIFGFLIFETRYGKRIRLDLEDKFVYLSEGVTEIISWISLRILIFDIVFNYSAPKYTLITRSTGFRHTFLYPTWPHGKNAILYSEERFLQNIGSDFMFSRNCSVI